MPILKILRGFILPLTALLALSSQAIPPRVDGGMSLIDEQISRTRSVLSTPEGRVAPQPLSPLQDPDLLRRMQKAAQNQNRWWEALYQTHPSRSAVLDPGRAREVLAARLNEPIQELVDSCILVRSKGLVKQEDLLSDALLEILSRLPQLLREGRLSAPQALCDLLYLRFAYLDKLQEKKEDLLAAYSRPICAYEQYPEPLRVNIFWHLDLFSVLARLYDDTLTHPHEQWPEELSFALGSCVTLQTQFLERAQRENPHPLTPAGHMPACACDSRVFHKLTHVTDGRKEVQVSAYVAHAGAHALRQKGERARAYATKNLSHGYHIAREAVERWTVQTAHQRRDARLEAERPQREAEQETQRRVGRARINALLDRQAAAAAASQQEPLQFAAEGVQGLDERVLAGGVLAARPEVLSTREKIKTTGQPDDRAGLEEEAGAAGGAPPEPEAPQRLELHPAIYKLFEDVSNCQPGLTLPKIKLLLKNLSVIVDQTAKGHWLLSFNLPEGEVMTHTLGGDHNRPGGYSTEIMSDLRGFLRKCGLTPGTVISKR